MAIRRTQIRTALSVGRAMLAQHLDGVRPARFALERIAPADVRRLAPRWTPGVDPRIADVARPVRFPQRGFGAMTLDALPDARTDEFARLATAARRRSRVVLHVPAGADESWWSSVVALAANGVPLELVDGLGEPWLGVELARQLESNGAELVDREMASIRTRRLAHDRIADSRGRPVSVLLASRRPDDIEQALDQIRLQRDCQVQVVLGLHGDQWPDDLGGVTSRLPDGSWVERFEADWSLGRVLDALVQRADAELVTKWDDDDWYGVDHLADLVRAYAYSGADVVGKAAEFVRLEGADLTIRRFAIGAESYSWTLAGGTLITSKSFLSRIGGWPDVRRGVDRELLEATRRAGGTAYRTHGFQYVLRRRASSTHTWGAADAHFLASATRRRAGLDLAFADICAQAGTAQGSAS